MTSLEQLARKAILKLTPYESARSLAVNGEIFLDANESAESVAYDEGQEWGAGLNRYPLPQPPTLLQAFAEYYDVPPGQILAGRGSDEAIDLLTRAFCEPRQDKIIIHSPTYGMYEVSARIQDAGVISVPLVTKEPGWELDIPEILRVASDPATNIKIIYICSPNNPTGTLFSKSAVEEICAKAENSLVVVDEAYAEFSSKESMTTLLPRFPRLVVLRTMSKAWALAGLRCGVLIANSEIITLLQKIRAPYPLPQPVVELALRALSPSGRDKMRSRVAKIAEERGFLGGKLAVLPSVEKVFPSEGNFLLVRFRDGSAAMRAAQSAGIIMRSRAKELGLGNCVRITIGSRRENERLLAVLGDLR